MSSKAIRFGDLLLPHNVLREKVSGKYTTKQQKLDLAKAQKIRLKRIKCQPPRLNPKKKWECKWLTEKQKIFERVLLTVKQKTYTYVNHSYATWPDFRWLVCQDPGRVGGEASLCPNGQFFNWKVRQNNRGGRQILRAPNFQCHCLPISGCLCVNWLILCVGVNGSFAAVLSAAYD